MKKLFSKPVTLTFTVLLVTTSLIKYAPDIALAGETLTPPPTTKTELISQEKKTPSHYPIIITTYNFAQKPVKMFFTEAPKRVVAVYQSPIEIMLALGLGNRIVAAVNLDTPVKDAYKKAFDKIRYFDKKPPKEEILALEPDFLLSWYSLFAEKNYGDIDFWNERGTKTYIWQNAGLKSPNTLNNEYQDIINIGKIFNVENKAYALVDAMKSKIEIAKNWAQGRKKVRTIILEVEKEGRYRIYGEDSIGGNVASQVGADLVAKKNGVIGKEELIRLNPDVIFSVYYGSSIIKKQAVNEISEDPALESLSAVKTARIYPIVLSDVYASGIRTLDGIKAIIAGLYPPSKSSFPAP